VLTYATGWSLWGNPNSLGAVMGVLVMPFLQWGYLIAEKPTDRYRFGVGMLICAILLYIALSRASLLAAGVSTLVLYVCLRRQRLLVKVAFAMVLLLSTGAVISPGSFDKFKSELTQDLLYKGKPGEDVLGSRRGPWEDTMASLREHPWFGTGFGTSDFGSGDEASARAQAIRKAGVAGIAVKGGTNREHGNSYLALAEYVGLIGLLPFGLLFAVVLRMILRMCVWMYRTANPRHCAIPLAMVLLAGMVHGFFEDWLVAVGYYLCVFFWITVFLLNDLLPQWQPLHLPDASPAHPLGPPKHAVAFTPFR